MKKNYNFQLRQACLLSLFVLFMGQSAHTQSRPVNRTLDGTLNNLSYPNFGTLGIPFFRELPAEYADGKNALAGSYRPTPRLISNKLSDESEDTRNERDMSGLFYIWGQFIDHDFSRVKSGTESAPISLPSDEKKFSSPIPFKRSSTHPGSGVSSPRDQTNSTTSWIDGSQLYGTTYEVTDWLRSHEHGKMRLSSGDLLPFNTYSREYDDDIDPNAPKMDDDYNRTNKTFAAGDSRANEHPGLTSLHILFLREHNRICDRLKNQGWSDDERMFQRARKEVGALIQAVTYGQWISSLGVQLSSYSGYKPHVRPDVMNTFSTAAYRWHTMVENDIILRDNDCHGVGPVEIPLKNVFNNISIVRKNGISVLLKGLSVHRQYETDLKVNSGLRNSLLGPGSGLDLVSINLQRGRDHGLPNYNAVRAYYTGSYAKKFSDITSDGEVASKMQSLYGDVNNIDLWVGLYAEPRLKGKSVGKTVDAMLRAQLEKLRDGDYYYFLNDPELAYDRSRIMYTKLGDIIARNSNAGNFQDNVFFRKSCSSSGDDIANYPCNVTPSFEEWVFLGKYGSNNYYKLKDASLMTHRDAYLRAKTMGGHLPVITNYYQNAFITSKMGSANVWINIEAGAKEWLYSNGAKAGFMNFFDGDKNGKIKIPKGGLLESTAIINPNGYWYNVDPNSLRSLVIEIPCGSSSQFLESNDVLVMDAKAEPDKALIEWVNNTGFKNDYFTVEKMDEVNGKFQDIATVNSLSIENDNTQYTAYDNLPTEGENTYRIKVTYQDGSTKYSEPKTLTFKGLAELRVFPNPANDAVSIDLSSYKNQDVEVYLYTNLGQQKSITRIENVESALLKLDISNEHEGNYMIRIKSKGKRDVIKSVIIAH